MVSNMKDWCNQSVGNCTKCKNQGFYLLKNIQEPLGQEYIPKYCDCRIGTRLLEIDSVPPLKKMASWDEIWMGLAKKISTKSTCKVPNRQVGCVIVSDDNTKVLAIGYNGGAKGDDNNCDYSGGEVKAGSSRCTCVHAEMNALVKLDTSNPIAKRMYLTVSPCKVCYKLIVNAGIQEVIYMSEYDTETNHKLKNLGVKVREMKDETNRS